MSVLTKCKKKKKVRANDVIVRIRGMGVCVFTSVHTTEVCVYCHGANVLTLFERKSKVEREFVHIGHCLCSRPILEQREICLFVTCQDEKGHRWRSHFSGLNGKVIVYLVAIQTETLPIVWCRINIYNAALTKIRSWHELSRGAFIAQQNMWKSKEIKDFFSMTKFSRSTVSKMATNKYSVK